MTFVLSTQGWTPKIQNVFKWPIVHLTVINFLLWLIKPTPAYTFGICRPLPAVSQLPWPRECVCKDEKSHFTFRPRNTNIFPSFPNPSNTLPITDHGENANQKWTLDYPHFQVVETNNLVENLTLSPTNCPWGCYINILNPPFPYLENELILLPTP